jgi:hypothetical protein
MVPTQQFELHGEQFNTRVLDIFESKDTWLDDECIKLVFRKFTETIHTTTVSFDGDKVEYVFVYPYVLFRVYHVDMLFMLIFTIHALLFILCCNIDLLYPFSWL